MKVLSSRLLASTICLAALLGGCGSSSNTLDDGLQDDQLGADTSTNFETVLGTDTEADPSSDIETDLGTDTETYPSSDIETDLGTGTETDPSSDIETDLGTDTDTDPSSETDTDADLGTETDSSTYDVTGTDADAGADTEVDVDAGSPPSSGLDILAPNVAADSDLERLISGINSQVALTLLDLNERLSQGVELTNQQEVCLGTYDPAVGEQLLAIDCEQALATNEINIYVSEAAFYDTDECNASLFNGNTDNCQLQRAGMFLPDLFRIADGERRPTLVFAGRKISYALTDTLLHIESLDAALAGVFECDIELDGGSSSTPMAGTSCSSIIASTADHLDDALLQ